LTILRRLACGLSSLILRSCSQVARAKSQDNLPSDTPETFNVSTNAFDFFKREVIPMRDGVGRR
jgi:hypothetical protein